MIIKKIIITALLALSSVCFALPVPKLPIQTKPVFTMTTPLDLMDLDQWAGFITALNSLDNPGKSVQLDLHVTGTGGDMLLTQDVEHAMQFAESNGTIINAIVDGPAISGHAFLTCAANKVTVLPGGSLTFHYVGGEVHLFNLPIVMKVYDTMPEMVTSFNAQLAMCKAKGLITDQDINDISNGKRVIYANENGKIMRYSLPDYDRSISELASQVLGWVIFVLVIGWIIRFTWWYIK